MNFPQFNQLVFAQAAPATPNTSGGLISMVVMFGIMFVLLYFLIIRPQKKKEQQRIQMIQNVKKNDYVLTTGGIYGTILAVKDNEVTLRVDDNVKIKLAKSAILGVEKQSTTEEGVN